MGITVDDLRTPMVPPPAAVSVEWCDPATGVRGLIRCRTWMGAHLLVAALRLNGVEAIDVGSRS